MGRIQDAYVRAMVSFSSSGVFTGGYGYGEDDRASGFGRPKLKEYDEKVALRHCSRMYQEPNDCDICTKCQALPP